MEVVMNPGILELTGLFWGLFLLIPSVRLARSLSRDTIGLVLVASLMLLLLESLLLAWPIVQLLRG